MTRRRLLCGLLLLSGVLACFGGWLWITRPRATRERFEQVKKGMSRDEVARTVGVPPGNYSNGGVYPVLDHPVMIGSHQSWLCDDGYLLVHFDEADTAIDVVVSDVTYLKTTLTERIRRWLGL